MTVQWLPLDIISLWFATILWLKRKDNCLIPPDLDHYISLECGRYIIHFKANEIT